MHLLVIGRKQLEELGRYVETSNYTERKYPEVIHPNDDGKAFFFRLSSVFFFTSSKFLTGYLNLFFFLMYL